MAEIDTSLRKKRKAKQSKDYYLKNKEAILLKQKERRLKYPKKVLQIKRKNYLKTKCLPKTRFSTARHTAKVRELVWEIDLEHYKYLLASPCYYCGKSLNNEMGVGLDRIDNSKGYTHSNVLPCCGSCNKIRHTALTVDEMLVAMKAIQAYRIEKQPKP